MTSADVDQLGSDQSSDGSTRARIRAAADRVEECREALSLAIEHRDDLIVTAIDEDSHSTREVARWARLAQPTVVAILAVH